MLNSKTRAKLRTLANKTDTIFQIGKNGISDETVHQVDEALTARELIKLHVLDSSPVSVHEAAEELAEKSRADVVQVIGGRFVLYRKNHEKPKIVL
jgi:RNA-binding protein